MEGRLAGAGAGGGGGGGGGGWVAVRQKKRSCKKLHKGRPTALIKSLESPFESN